MSKKINKHIGQGIGRIANESQVISFKYSLNVVATTKSHLKLTLLDILKKAEKKDDWKTPLAMLLTIIVALVTSPFRDFIFTAITWFTIFAIGGIGSFFWLIWSLIIRASIKIDLDQIIQEIIESSEIKEV